LFFPFVDGFVDYFAVVEPPPFCSWACFWSVIWTVDFAVETIRLPNHLLRDDS
jgi:hypothetical protein